MSHFCLIKKTTSYYLYNQPRNGKIKGGGEISVWSNDILPAARYCLIPSGQTEHLGLENNEETDQHNLLK